MIWKPRTGAGFEAIRGGVDLIGKKRFWLSCDLPPEAVKNIGKTLFDQLLDFLSWTIFTLAGVIDITRVPYTGSAAALADPPTRREGAFQ